MEPLIAAELNRLESEGIIESVDAADVAWLTPIIAVRKANNKIRLCGSYDLTLNPHIESDFLSRCSYKNLNYCSDEAEEVPEYSEVIMSISDNTTLDIERVKVEIPKDDTLRIVKNYVTNGWPEKVNQL